MDFVKENREKYKLLYPLNSPESDINVEDEEISNDVSESKKISSHQSTVIEECDILEKPEDHDFYHESITREEAEKKLMDQPKGTFLIR